MFFIVTITAFQCLEEEGGDGGASNLPGPFQPSPPKSPKPTGDSDENLEGRPLKSIKFYRPSMC